MWGEGLLAACTPGAGAQQGAVILAGVCAFVREQVPPLFHAEGRLEREVQTSPLPTFKISSIKWSEFKHTRLFRELGQLPGSAETQIWRE